MIVLTRTSVDDPYRHLDGDHRMINDELARILFDLKER